MVVVSILRFLAQRPEKGHSRFNEGQKVCLGNVLRSVSHQSYKIKQARSINHPHWLFPYIISRHQQCSLRSRGQVAIYLRHLPDDLVHVDRLETSVELIASVKIDMLPGNRRDIAEPDRVFNISGAVHVVQKT